jgi:hypothetical protein
MTKLSSQFTYKVITRIFETIQGVGQGTITTECDGIPRFSFLHKPNTSTTSMVTVTQTVAEAPSQFPNSKAIKPSCWLSPEELSCEKNLAEYLIYRRKYPYFSFFEEWLFEVATACFSRNTTYGLELLPNNLTANSSIDTCRTGFDNELVLIYWPPVIESRNICANNGRGSGATVYDVPSGKQRVATLSAITLQGQDLYHRLDIISGSTMTKETGYLTSSVLQGPFTFTSPNVYIAHYPMSVTITRHPLQNITDARQLTADSTYTTFGRSAGILTLKPKDIFTLGGEDIRPDGGAIGGLEYAKLVARGQYITPDTPDIGYFPLTMNFGDLQHPIPASIYYDARSQDCWGRQTHCNTITDDNYRPAIIVRDKVWESLFPHVDFRTCLFGGVMDPPITLTEIPRESVVEHYPQTVPFSVDAAPTPIEDSGLSDRIPWKWRALPGGVLYQPFIVFPTPTPLRAEDQGVISDDSRPERTPVYDNGRGGHYRPGENIKDIPEQGSGEKSSGSGRPGIYGISEQGRGSGDNKNPKATQFKGAMAANPRADDMILRAILFGFCILTLVSTLAFS